MKKIFIPVGIIVLILAIIAVILSKTSPTNPGYHVHEDGSTHYDVTVTLTAKPTTEPIKRLYNKTTDKTVVFSFSYSYNF